MTMNATNNLTALRSRTKGYSMKGESTWMLKVAALGAICMVLVGGVLLSAHREGLFQVIQNVSVEQSGPAPDIEISESNLAYFSLVESLVGTSDVGMPGTRNEQGRLLKHVAWLSWISDSAEASELAQEPISE